MNSIFALCDRCHGRRTRVYPVWVKGRHGAWLAMFCSFCENKGKILNQHRMSKGEREDYEDEQKLKNFVQSFSMNYEDWKRAFFAQTYAGGPQAGGRRSRVHAGAATSC